MSVQSKPVGDIVSVIFGCLLFGGYCIADNNEELNKILSQAHAGDADAQYELAEKYYRGDDVQRNYDEAFSWYEKAANQNHVEAQHQMGYFYQHGLDKIVEDDKKAFEWFHKAAKLGHTSSQTQIAIMYSQGIGVEQNKELSRQWSKRVLEKKGMIDSGRKPSGGANKTAPQPESKLVQQPVVTNVKRTQAVNASPATGVLQASVQLKAVTSKPKLSAEEYKAWRREQARRLVEEANSKAVAEGEWSDE